MPGKQMLFSCWLKFPAELFSGHTRPPSLPGRKDVQPVQIPVSSFSEKLELDPPGYFSGLRELLNTIHSFRCFRKVHYFHWKKYCNNYNYCNSCIGHSILFEIFAKIVKYCCIWTPGYSAHLLGCSHRSMRFFWGPLLNIFWGWGLTSNFWDDGAPFG